MLLVSSWQGDPQEAPPSEEAPSEAAVEAPEEVSVVKVKLEEREEEEEEPEAETVTRCKFCNETFYEPSLLTEHMATHTDDVTGACLICGKSLGRTSAEIRQHMMVHSGEKPFSCKVCGRRFIRTLALKTHMKTHEQSAEEVRRLKKKHIHKFDNQRQRQFLPRLDACLKFENVNFQTQKCSLSCG